MKCVYRSEGENEEADVSFPFKFLSNTKCSGCQVLQDQGANDTNCYNPELNEKTCAISPQANDTSTPKLV